MIKLISVVLFAIKLEYVHARVLILFVLYRCQADKNLSDTVTRDLLLRTTEQTKLTSGRCDDVEVLSFVS